MLTEASGIRQRAADLYAHLYDSEYTEVILWALNSFCSGLPRVLEEINKELEGPLTAEEVYTALQSMQGGKTPGINGLPPEFFKAFCNELREDVLEVLIESLTYSSMEQSFRRAVLTL